MVSKCFKCIRYFHPYLGRSNLTSFKRIQITGFCDNFSHHFPWQISPGNTGDLPTQKPLVEVESLYDNNWSEVDTPMARQPSLAWRKVSLGREVRMVQVVGYFRMMHTGWLTETGTDFFGKCESSYMMCGLHNRTILVVYQWYSSWQEILADIDPTWASRQALTSSSTSLHELLNDVSHFGTFLYHGLKEG